MRDYLEQLRAGGGVAGPGLVAFAILALTAFAYFRIALLPEFGAELAMSTLQLGVVTTVFAVGRLAADIPAGRMADRFVARGILAGSAAAIAVGSLVIGLSGAVLTLYLASFLLGVASSITNATGMTYFSNAAGADFRGTSMAVFSAALLGGQAVGPAAAGLVASATGWRAAMYWASAAAGLVALTLVMSAGRGAAVRSSTVSRAGSEANGGTVPKGLMIVLHSVPFVGFLTLGSVPATLVPIVGSQTLGLGSAAIGLALGVGGATRFVGTLIGGRISDRVSRKAALVPALIVQGLGVALLALPLSVALWLTAIVVMSISSFGVAVAATMVGDLVDPSRLGRHLGQFRFAGDLGLILGPVAISAVYESISGPAAFLIVAFLLAGVGILCLRLLPETQPRSAARRAGSAGGGGEGPFG